MKLLLTVYLVIALSTYMNLLIANHLYRGVRLSINSKDRKKVDEKVNSIITQSKLSAVWPYMLYKLIK